MRLMRTLTIVVLLAGGFPPVVAAQQPQPTPDEFVPMTEVPPEEQLPAPTMLAAAYGFAWIAILGYFWVVSRRVGRVEAELRRLEGQSE